MLHGVIITTFVTEKGKIDIDNQSISHSDRYGFITKRVIFQEGSISFHLVKMIGETVLRSCIFCGMLVVDLE